VKLRLNASEMADWQELWCFRCENDHTYSHTIEEGNGCGILADNYLADEADDLITEFVPFREDWWRTIPASVTCSAFKACTKCPTESPDEERRQGQTRREFYDGLRAEMIAKGVGEAMTKAHDEVA